MAGMALLVADRDVDHRDVGGIEPRHGLAGLSDALRPHYEAMEQLLAVSEVPWEGVTRNNRLLKQGAEINGHQGTGSEAGNCPLTPKAETESLLQHIMA